MTKAEQAFESKQVHALRANYQAGRSARYILRCGLHPAGKVAVHDCAGGWVCSFHKTTALAQKRADELNREVAMVEASYRAECFCMNLMEKITLDRPISGREVWSMAVLARNLCEAVLQDDLFTDAAERQDSVRSTRNEARAILRELGFQFVSPDEEVAS